MPCAHHHTAFSTGARMLNRNTTMSPRDSASMALAGGQILRRSSTMGGSPKAQANAGRLIRILAIDDHALVRAGLRQYLAEFGDMAITGEADSADDAIVKIRTDAYDIALLDMSMTDRTGVALLNHIRLERPALPILVLSMDPVSRYAVPLLRCGANGYLQKEALPTELIDAVRRICSGRRHISGELAELLADHVSGSGSCSLHDRLSDRETVVFMKLARGEPVTAIAAALQISGKTVSTYRGRVLEKLKLSSNAGLTHYAITNGLT